MRNEVEEARDVLRWAVDRASLRSVAGEIGIGHSVLSRFLSGKAQKPGTDALALMIPYVAKRRGEYAEAHQIAPQPTSDALVAVGIGAGTMHPNGSVTLSAQTFGYVVARLEALSELAADAGAQLGAASQTASAMSSTLSALRGTVERAAGNASGLRGQIQPARASVAAAHAELDELRAEMVAKEPALGPAAPAPAQRKSVNGGRGA